MDELTQLANMEIAPYSKGGYVLAIDVQCEFDETIAERQFFNSPDIEGLKLFVALLHPRSQH